VCAGLREAGDLRRLGGFNSQERKEEFYTQHCFTDRVGMGALFIDSASFGLVTGIAHGDTFYN
jgi:hypothetical protein